MTRLTLTALLLPMILGGCTLAPPPVVEIDGESGRVLGDVVVQVSEHASEGLDAIEPAADVLTPGEAIRRAVLHDPRLQAALAHVRAARADADQARLLPNPILSVSVR